MPELPEVETIRRGLNESTRGQAILGVETSTKRLRLKPGPRSLHELEGQSIEDWRRHGKFLMATLSQGVLVVHLGMTGKLLFAEPGSPRLGHTHLTLELSGGQLLHYVDARRFGSLRLYPAGGKPPELERYGPDALAPDFTEAYLHSKLAGSRAPLKAFLLDQTKVAGVGNIYACEALWRAGLSPRRLACNTPKRRVALLRQSIVDVLEDSLAQGGTSFNDYVNALGVAGEFLLQVAVFRREGHACPVCGSKIQRLVQSGRSTFYCPSCQR